GMETALKLDVARARPELRLAYSRPGLVTFKSTRAVAPDDTPGSVFAHVWGRSVGAASDPATAALQLAPLGAARVPVFAREPDDGEQHPAPAAPQIADVLAPWHGLGPGGEAQIGELVADVIVAPVAGEPAWLGVHRHDRFRLPRAGGAIPVAV